MRILLPQQIARRLQVELRRARRREIGGLLMGEHLHKDVFRVVDLTVQQSGGSVACFVRHPKSHLSELNRFFERTGANYTRYNYLGEWHSHPSFAPLPSQTDRETMQSIVSDATVGANFLVLMIVKLAGRDHLQVSAAAFRPDVEPVDVLVEVEGDRPQDNSARQPRVVQWVRRLFSW